ncbi:phage portal protein [Saccharopolyspora mangrovi]|uniref:Phage portal protein n=1 Tax=Saccharopolyspora mangrovi TaxID=3082379 RepID=A0ABU6A7P2_9PSEU|nr:phage portal protein [Saccharopolyspora sp. S2-29]MEB3367409.1 phage portal protein [Saccharopolyspora sp. S2-29]
MTLFKRLAGLGKKGFSQPNFWEAGDESSLPFLSSALHGNEEPIGNNFEAYVQGAYKQNGVIFACIQARQMAFSEGRFAMCKNDKDGRPGALRYGPELELLERPWPGGTQGELLSRMEQDVSLAGNFYATVVDDAGRVGRRAIGPSRRVVRLRPDWVTIVIGSKKDPNGAHPWDIDNKVIAYEYNPPVNGMTTGVLQELQRDHAVLLLPEDVCHYSPIPDPAMRYRGMSWLTPVVEEVRADRAATKHKLKFFELGGSPKTAVSLDKEITAEDFKKFVELFKEQHQGVDNAYRTMFLAGGANVSTVGADLRQLDFKVTQGAGETRIAAASGVPPIIVGLSEGLASATYSNYGQARRRFADNTVRPLWRSAGVALERLVQLGEGEHLRIDDRDIAFLREDLIDRAEIQQKQAIQIRQLVDGGFDPDSVVRAVVKYDLSELEHTGLMSVQLLPPGLGTIDPITGEPMAPDPAMTQALNGPTPPQGGSSGISGSPKPSAAVGGSTGNAAKSDKEIPGGRTNGNGN